MIIKTFLRLVKSFINRLLSLFGQIIESKSLSHYKNQQLNVAGKLIQVYTSPDDASIKNQSECIVFSMDRAMQLHALLGSYIHHVKKPAPVHILYMASDDIHNRAYLEVLDEFKFIIAKSIKQDSKESFREQLVDILRNIHSNKIFFLVDDNIFTEETDLSMFDRMDTKVIIPSLRLGVNLKRSYTVDKDQPLPPLYTDAATQNLVNATPIPANPAEKDDLVYWAWQEGTLDWAYPLSVDGHIFNTREILCLAENTGFNSPNTFENNLQQYYDFFKHRFGVCYKKSRLINVPCNRVQSDFENLHGSLYQDDLLKLWNNGKCIDFVALKHFQNESAHEDLPLTFIDRIR